MPKDLRTFLKEYEENTDPTNPDTDGDGVIDSEDNDPLNPPGGGGGRSGCGSTAAAALIVLLLLRRRRSHRLTESLRRV